MEKVKAQKLVRETLKASFDRQRFRDFINELCNGFDEAKSQNMGVPDAFSAHVKSCQRIGTYESPEGELLDVLIVNLTEDYKLDRTRTALRDFVAHKLKREDSYKEAGLVAFVAPDSKSWRFSYVRMEYETKRDPQTGKIKAEERLTPARRYSYIVGEEEECHTAQTRFLDLLQDTDTKPTLSNLEEAFSVETVTKEFFTEYKRLFEVTESALSELVKKDSTLRADFERKKVSTVDFAKKLLGQIVFLYFIQKKGWMGVPKGGQWGQGKKNFLRHIATLAIQKGQCLFNDVLEPLFYKTLADDRGHEAWCETFQCRIPFLNGGLFEPIAGYDWQHTSIAFPNTLFTNQQTTPAGDTGTGILDVFDRYNFTVNEAEPMEKEVAIDPEMLGKVFENLLEDNRRKGLGAYYTPREIVHYMCQESLINYLDTALNQQSETSQVIIPRSDIETFIREGEQASHYEAARKDGTVSYRPKLPKSIETHAREIDEALASITVCDPAIGSGAFPVGMMSEIVRARATLTPYFNDISDRTAYHFKRHAIQSSIYGVDIDAGAVEIAKLRLWLSLVVDEDDVKQIKPLPNLDYKVVTGNSLLGADNAELEGWQTRNTLLELKNSFFNESDSHRKSQIKTQIESILDELLVGRRAFDFQIYFSEIFQRKNGFDIVIGNPPYLRIQGLQETQPQLVPIYKAHFKSAYGSFDLYGLFIERGFSLLGQRGNFAFIVPHKFFQATFGKGLRALLMQNKALRQVVRFGAEQVFDEATTYTCLLFLSKTPQETFQLHELKSIACAEQAFQAIHRRQQHPACESATVPQPKSDDWDFHTGKGNTVIEKLKAQGTTLGDITRKIFQGIATSADKIYVLRILEERKDTFYCYSKQLNTNIEIEKGLVKPFLMGRDVHRYQPPTPKNVVIFPYKIQDNSPTLMSQKYIREHFPLGWEYLKINKKDLEDRERGRMKVDGFYAYIYPKNLTEFEAVKIMTPDICNGSQMTIDETETLYHTTTLYSFVFKETIKDDPKYLLGVLNSRLLWYFMKVTGAVLRGGFFRFNTNYLRPFPIPCSLSRNPPSKKDQTSVAQLADRILTAKRQNPDADTTAWEKEIDSIVYRLYDLTSEEIKIVEEGVK